MSFAHSTPPKPRTQTPHPTPTPNTQFLIVETLRQAGFACGMTGDGVNDAPALKKADVGIAVAGATDAARAAADIVLTGEGLSVIIEGIIISREIFQRVYNFFNVWCGGGGDVRGAVGGGVGGGVLGSICGEAWLYIQTTLYMQLYVHQQQEHVQLLPLLKWCSHMCPLSSTPTTQHTRSHSLFLSHHTLLHSHSNTRTLLHSLSPPHTVSYCRHPAAAVVFLHFRICIPTPRLWVES